jgi:choline dehydrogenase-like flavoprotein
MTLVQGMGGKNMLIDARALPSGTVLETDVCVVGAGAAGISLAREFAGAQFSVMLLEGGGLHFEHASQFLHRGIVRGRPYGPLETTHRRQFGGTTAVWFGRCRPLDAIDFEARPWVPNSGWPLSRSNLDPYYARAGTLCELGSNDYSVGSGALGESGLEAKLYRFSPPTHFGQKYSPLLLSARNVRLLIHANAVSLLLDRGGTAATRVNCATLNGKKLSVAARMFILAGGAIENTRLLLNSRDVHAAGVGNANDLVGRFFMEHVGTFIAAASAIPDDLPPAYLRLNYQGVQRNLQPTLAFGFSEARLRQDHLLNARAFLVKRPLYKTDDRFYSGRVRGFVELVETAEHRRPPSRAILDSARHAAANAPTVLALTAKALAGKLGRRSQYGLELQCETVPNRESRLALTSQSDALGTPRVCLDWRLTDQDLDCFRRAGEYLLGALDKSGVRLRRLGHAADADGWPVSIAPSSHHLGTTRMSTNPRLGVVDQHCRIHGIGNVYIAGGSIFPTAGMANPTLTIIALAVRLADHVKQVLG